MFSPPSLPLGCDCSWLHVNLSCSPPPGGARSVKVSPQATGDPLLLSKKLTLPPQVEKSSREVRTTTWIECAVCCLSWLVLLWCVNFFTWMEKKCGLKKIELFKSEQETAIRVDVSALVCVCASLHVLYCMFVSLPLPLFLYTEMTLTARRWR